MANRNFLTPGAVPELSGNPVADLQRLRDYLVQMMSQLEYVLQILQEQNDE